MYTGADLKNLCRESAMVALRGMRTTSNVVNCQLDSEYFYFSLNLLIIYNLYIEHV